MKKDLGILQAVYPMSVLMIARQTTFMLLVERL